MVFFNLVTFLERSGGNNEIPRFEGVLQVLLCRSRASLISSSRLEWILPGDKLRLGYHKHAI